MLRSALDRSTTPDAAAWVQPAAAALLAVAAGIATVYLPEAGLLFALVFVLVCVSRVRFAVWVALTMVVVIGLPIVKLSGVTQLAVSYENVSLPLQIVVVFLTVVLAMVLLVAARSDARIRGVLSPPSLVFLMWCGAVVLTVFAHEGTLEAGAAGLKEPVYYLVAAFVIVPFALVALPAPRAARLVVMCVVVASGLSAVVAVMVYVVPSLRAQVYGGTMYAGSTRVGFATASIFSLTLPIVIVLLERSDRRGWARFWLMSCVLLTLGALLVAQSRTLLVAALANVALVLVAPRIRRPSGGIRRALVAVVAVVLVLGLAFTLAAVAGVRRAASLPADLGERLTALQDPLESSTVQGRLQTAEVALAEWVATPGSFALGRGFEVTFGLYSRDGSVAPYRISEAVDNAWVTEALKGGILLAGALALTLIGSFAGFVRCARRSADPELRAVFGALALSLPLFALEATVLTSHYPVVPAVTLTLACLAAASVLGSFGAARGSAASAPAAAHSR